MSLLRSQHSDSFIHCRVLPSHDRVKAAEMRFLKQHWDEIKGSNQVAEMLMKIASGRYPHAAPILTDIWQSVSMVGV